jgi:hypothetical protein
MDNMPGMNGQHARNEWTTCPEFHLIDAEVTLATNC